MKKQVTKVGKVQFVIEVPETITEFDGIHGREGAVLDKAINYDVAHTILGKIRQKVGAELVKLGFKRDVASTDEKGEETYKPIDTKWIDRGFAALSLDLAAQTKLFQATADEVGYDVSGTRGGNKDFNQVDLRDAKSLLEAIKLGKSSFERIKANLEARNPGLEVATEENGEFTAEQLAAGLKVERARVEAERQGALL